MRFVRSPVAGALVLVALLSACGGGGVASVASVG